MLAFALTAAVAPGARAFEEIHADPAAGDGGRSRAWAIGDAGPLLNPSGMTLVKAYTLEGTYGYGTRQDDQFLHASVVDNTSSYNLAGGIYYTYHSMDPSGGVLGPRPRGRAGAGLSVRQLRRHRRHLRALKYFKVAPMAT